ncbi:hypothetical protein RCIP0081_00026 [Klebsiella phage RCIP0081]
MYGVFGYARKLLIVKVNSPPLCLGYFGVFSGNRSLFDRNEIIR